MSRSVRIKDHQHEQQLFERRALAAAIIMTLGILAIVGRLVWLQVVKYDYYVQESQGNRIKIEPIPPNRGLILDRNGYPLATNAPSYQLELTREQVPDLDRTLVKLAELGLFTKDDIAAIKKDIRSRRSFEAVPVKLQLTEKELARFAARRHDFPGVEIVPRMTRFYPLGSSSVHAIGYVGAISEDDKKILNMENYAGTTLTGKTGVERAYESELQGSAGFQQLLVNAQGRRVDRVGRTTADLVRKEPIAGNDLFLTIDHRVQQIAEESLRGQRASAIALDPSNGDVIAYVSTPAFDPNPFARGLSRAEYIALTEDPNRPMYDRAIRGVYPPGSTVKPLFAMAALEYGVIAPTETRFCRGVWSSPGYGRARRDWEPRGHGFVDMRKAIATSCDVYFYDIARLMGIDRMAAFLGQFGLGRPTGIQGIAESAGLIPDPEWKLATIGEGWATGDAVNMAIGQGYVQVTPLQMANIAAAIANGGTLYRPTLVDRIGESPTSPEEMPEPHVNGVLPLSAEQLAVVRESLWNVTHAGNGTATHRFVDMPVPVAGKTGTAEAPPGLPHAWFVGYAPAEPYTTPDGRLVETPELAIAVVLEHAGEGSDVAAPLFRRVVELYYGIEPTPFPW